MSAKQDSTTKATQTGVFRRINLRRTLLICGGAALMVAAILMTQYLMRPRIAYVRSSDLISKYAGTIESHEVAQKTQDQRKANLDTLQGDYRRAMNIYNESYAKLSPAERSDREDYLAKHEQQIVSYAQEAGKMAEEEEEKLMQGVLSQINSFIASYGKEHGYDMILGTTAAGSLLYAEDGYDITDEVLNILNAQYKSTNATTASR